MELDKVLAEVDGKPEHLCLGLMMVDFLTVILCLGHYPNNEINSSITKERDQILTDTAKVLIRIDSALSTSIA